MVVIEVVLWWIAFIREALKPHQTTRSAEAPKPHAHCCIKIHAGNKEERTKARDNERTDASRLLPHKHIIVIIKHDCMN